MARQKGIDYNTAKHNYLVKKGWKVSYHKRRRRFRLIAPNGQVFHTVKGAASALIDHPEIVSAAYERQAEIEKEVDHAAV